MSQSKSLVVRTIPCPTRAEILALYDQGLGTQAVATQLQISLSWARKVKQDRREQGKTANATTRHRQPAWAPLVPRIQVAIAAKSNLTLNELKAELGTTLHPGTLCRALRKLKLSFKKRSDGRRAGSAGCHRAACGLGGETSRSRPRKGFVSR